MSVQIIGRPEILWELDDPTNETNGTRRYWTLLVEQWLELSLPSRLVGNYLITHPTIRPRMLAVSWLA